MKVIFGTIQKRYNLDKTLEPKIVAEAKEALLSGLWTEATNNCDWLCKCHWTVSSSFHNICSQKIEPLWWYRNEVSGTLYAHNEKGWINHGAIFFFLEKHFLEHAVPCHPLLLMVDGHSTHSD